MRYENVCIESIGYALPEEIWTSEELEQRLLPLYQRLKLPSGRLELITGVSARRVWPRGTLPSEISLRSCQAALDVAQFERERIGALIHGSVCRDHLEPATASGVHHGLQLPFECTIYDTSNACLGILNGMVQAANMIELGQIEAALVVGSESSRQLLETTIDNLNQDDSWTRKSVKLAVASLTIGSASCAVLMTDRRISQTGNRLIGASAGANTKHHRLCHSGQDEAVADGMSPLMTTDSETLMREGIATGKMTFERFLSNLQWTSETIQRSFCHQVGSTHRKMMLESLGLPETNDFVTFDWLGNTGSAALPVTMAIGLSESPPTEPTRLALLGIGSGINSIMCGVEWRKSCIRQA